MGLMRSHISPFETTDLAGIHQGVCWNSVACGTHSWLSYLRVTGGVRTPLIQGCEVAAAGRFGSLRQLP